MHSRLVRYLLFFAALWLPMQTMAGMVASVCMSMPAHPDNAMPIDRMADGTAAMPCHEGPPGEPADRHDSCDHCAICHLASAGFMPSATPESNLPPPANRYAATPVATPPSHVAEPPQHPPRHAG